MGTLISFEEQKSKHALRRARAASLSNPAFGTLTDADPLLAAHDHVASQDSELFTPVGKGQVPLLTERGRRIIPPLLHALGYRDLPTSPEHFQRVRSEISRLAGWIVFNDPVTVRDLPAMNRS